MTPKWLKNIFSLRKSVDKKHLIATLFGLDVMRTGIFSNVSLNRAPENRRLARPSREELAKNKISIIMPVYNSADYLRETVGSLMNQTFSNLEIICVNDASTDNSLDILNECADKDPRVKVLDPGKVHQATARNLGLRAASGDYVMFCDSDDRYKPDACRRMLEIMLWENVDLVVCDCEVNVKDSGFRPTAQNNYHRLCVHGYRDLLASSDGAMQVNHVLWNKIYKKSLINEYDIRFPDGLEYDDAMFVGQYLMVANDLYGLPETLYHYLVRPNSVMDNVYRRKSVDHIYDRIHIVGLLADFIGCQRLSLSHPARSAFFRWIINDLIHWSFLALIATDAERAKGIMLAHDALERLNKAAGTNFKMDVRAHIYDATERRGL